VRHMRCVQNLSYEKPHKYVNNPKKKMREDDLRIDIREAYHEDWKLRVLAREPLHAENAS
jgi:hypothetical protein